MPSDDDRELQIELTKLQIKHEEAASVYTIFLSVFVSLIVTAIAVYVPLGITVNPSYITISVIFEVIMLIPFTWILMKWLAAQKTLPNEIMELKKQYLTKIKKEEQGSENTRVQRAWRKWFKKTENIALILSLVALIFTGLIVVHEYYPPAQRAKLTVFLDNPGFGHLLGNVTEVDLEGRIVNEGSLAGKILRWDLFISMNASYKTLLDRFEISPTNLLLSPAEEGNFTMQRTLIGENDTRLPDIAIRSCIAWFEYRDASGLQVAQGEVDFS